MTSAPRRLRVRLAADDGNMSVLTTGILVVVLLVLAAGVSITGVHLERKELQAVADGAALRAASSVPGSSFYPGDVRRGPGGDPVLPVTEATARRAATDYLASYPLPPGRTSGHTVTVVSAEAGGEVTVRIGAATDPPLIGWLTSAFQSGVPIWAESTAFAR